jgi:hypothetical protein
MLLCYAERSEGMRVCSPDPKPYYEPAEGEMNSVEQDCRRCSRRGEGRRRVMGGLSRVRFYLADPHFGPDPYWPR